MLNNCGSFRNNRRFSEARYTLFFPTSIFLNSLSSYNSYNNKKNMHTTEKTQRRDDGFVNRAAHKTFVSLIVSRKKRLCGIRTTIDERLCIIVNLRAWMALHICNIDVSFSYTADHESTSRLRSTRKLQKNLNYNACKKAFLDLDTRKILRFKKEH